MGRLHQKNDLLVKLGRLFGPLQDLAEHPEAYDEQERAEALARYFAEYPELASEFESFSRGHPGHNYTIQYHKFFSALRGVQRDLLRNMDLAEVLPNKLATAIDAINAIPTPRSSAILDAGSPFTTYCFLKSLCEADAANEIVWIDPYLDMNVFHRFLLGVRSDVQVVLVTSQPGGNARPKDKTRWQQFLDISRLYAQEHGPKHYRLLVHPSLHDRWLILDQKRFFTLGGSAKDAGNRSYFTVGHLDASPENLQAVQDHITCGVEYFGPGTLVHRS